ncbi:MAG: hypothetical protein GEU93_07395 [Propionibacteriales bacterium]|nr:hypothetical protein [Propionibacteriales bacterium]
MVVFGTPRRGERGSLAPATAAMIVVLFFLGGLVIDGARFLNARSTGQAYAEEGARVMGQAMNFDTGEPELDTGMAAADVDAYCAEILQQDDRVTDCTARIVNAATGEVEVAITTSIQPGLLGIIPGITSETMTATTNASAVAEIGILEPGDGSRGGGVDTTVLENDDIRIGRIPTADPDNECGSGTPWPDAPPELHPFFYTFPEDVVPRRVLGCDPLPVCPQEPFNSDDEVEEARGEQPIYAQCPNGLLWVDGKPPECDVGERPRRDNCRPRQGPDDPPGNGP